MSKRFIVRDASLVQSPTVMYLTDDVLRRTILENNDKFELRRDARLMGTILYCENKPRDMPVYGIKWDSLEEG